MLVKPELNPPYHHNDKVYTSGRLAAYACCSFSVFHFFPFFRFAVNGVLKPLLMEASLCLCTFLNNFIELDDEHVLCLWLALVYFSSCYRNI